MGHAQRWRRPGRACGLVALLAAAGCDGPSAKVVEAKVVEAMGACEPALDDAAFARMRAAVEQTRANFEAALAARGLRGPLPEEGNLIMRYEGGPASAGHGGVGPVHVNEADGATHFIAADPSVDVEIAFDEKGAVHLVERRPRPDVVETIRLCGCEPRAEWCSGEPPPVPPTQVLRVERPFGGVAVVEYEEKVIARSYVGGGCPSRCHDIP